MNQNLYKLSSARQASHTQTPTLKLIVPEQTAMGDEYLEWSWQNRRVQNVSTVPVLRDRDHRLLKALDRLLTTTQPDVLLRDLQDLMTLVEVSSPDIRCEALNLFNRFLPEAAKRFLKNKNVFQVCKAIVLEWNAQLTENSNDLRREWVELEKAVYHLMNWEEDYADHWVQ